MYDVLVERTGVEVDQFKAWSDIVDSYFLACISEIGVKDSPHPLVAWATIRPDNKSVLN